MKNGDAFNEFLTKLIDNPKTMKEVRDFYTKLRDDEEFHITYLQCTSILMVRFPSLFESLMTGATEHMINELKRRIADATNSRIN